MSPNPLPTAELLAAHASSLRALARHLVGDPHAAEDVLQDTWVRAIERPPARLDALGGWLRTVLRNVVVNRRRDEARRGAREAAVARPEAQSTASDARARTLRAVVDAVLALDEPYRSTVLARYFEDLPPREIAQREGVSIHTIESRLQRALAKLRGRLSRELEEEAGGARHALLLLAGLPHRAATVAAGTLAATGAVVVGTKAKLGLGAASVAIVAWLAWMARPEPASPVEAAAPAGSGLVARAPVELVSAPRTPAQGAVAAGVEPSKPAPMAPSKTIVLELLVTDAEGVPQGDASVALAPARHPLNVVARTGSDGRAEVHLPITGPSVELVVAAWRSGQGVAGPWRFEAVPRGEVRITLALADPHPEVEGLLDEDRGDAIGRSPWNPVDGRAWDQQALFAVLENAPDAGRLGEDALLVGACDPLERMRATLSTLERLGYVDLDRNRLAEGLRDAVREAVAERDRPDRVRVVGSVVGQDGQAVVGALVLARLPDSVSGCATRTDDLGAFALSGLPPGQLVLSAYSRRWGRASERVEVLPGGVRVWEPVLDAGETWTGRLDARGGELPELSRIEWVSADKRHLDVRIAALDEGGRVALTNLPRDWGALVAATPWTSLPWVLDPKQAPRMQERKVRVDARDARTGELRLRVRPPRGDAEVRVWTLWKAPADRGMWMQRDDRSGQHVLAGLPHGRYTVELGSPTSGWVEMGPVDLTAGETFDLGTVDLPAPAHVRRAKDAQGTRWLLRRDAVETLVAVLEGSGQVSIACPAGSYLLADPDDRSRAIAFELAAGETVVVSDEGVLSREPPR